MFCAMVYLPPKYNKDFVNDFSDFLPEIMPKYGCALIVGDYVHLCCPDKLMAKDFLNLVDSFNFVQSVSGLLQEHRHTLDFVLFYGLPVFFATICDVVFSDHMPELFDVALVCNTIKPQFLGAVISLNLPLFFDQFLAVFSQNRVIPDTMCNDEEDLSSWFNSTCQTVLDSVAPVNQADKERNKKLSIG